MSVEEKLALGHVFKPTLEDISLKRCRLRYNTYDDVYYHHWADATCATVSQYKGLTQYLFSSYGVERRVDDRTGEAYLACKEGADSARMEWQVDFSACGLVVLSLKVRVRNVAYSGRDTAQDHLQDNVTFFIQGEDGFPLSLEMGEYLTEVTGLVGCKKLRIISSIQTSSSTASQHEGPVKILPCMELEDSPLDIIVELKCPRPTEDVYYGEILFGLKYIPDMQKANRPNSPFDFSHIHPSDGILSEGQDGSGQLHVHIVEGAGIKNELTHKPFNTVVKCELVPDSSGSKQTAPRLSVYPTWTEHFIFGGISRDHVTKGALEVMLYDHHHFHTDKAIGGVRMCNPVKKEDEIYSISLTAPCSPHSRCVSPLYLSPTSLSNGSRTTFPNFSFQHRSDDQDQQHINDSCSYKSPSGIASSYPHTFINTSSCRVDQLSPVSPSIVFPNSNGNSELKTFTNHKSLPRPIFHFPNRKSLSPNFSPRNSPRTSPLAVRKKLRMFRRHSVCEERESDFLYWWMEDVGEGERNQWCQMLEREGEWVYYWHCIHYRLRAAYGSC